jgi:hypothetical protein
MFDLHNQVFRLWRSHSERIETDISGPIQDDSNCLHSKPPFDFMTAQAAV